MNNPTETSPPTTILLDAISALMNIHEIVNEVKSEKLSCDKAIEDIHTSLVDFIVQMSEFANQIPNIIVVPDTIPEA